MKKFKQYMELYINRARAAAADHIEDDQYRFLLPLDSEDDDEELDNDAFTKRFVVFDVVF